MAETLFYHLTRRSLEQVLPDLLGRTLERGWRALVRCGSEPRAAHLNRMLWTFRDDSFLPHGAAGDGHAARQPVYLTTGDETPNAPDVLFLVDGAGAEPAAMAGFQRVCLLFDGADPAALTAARAAWKTVTEAGLKAVYWAEGEDGGWVKKAEKG